MENMENTFSVIGLLQKNITSFALFVIACITFFGTFAKKSDLARVEGKTDKKLDEKDFKIFKEESFNELKSDVKKTLEQGTAVQLLLTKINANSKNTYERIDKACDHLEKNAEDMKELQDTVHKNEVEMYKKLGESKQC